MRHLKVVLAVLTLLASAVVAAGQPTGASINMGELPFGQVFFTLGGTGASTLVDLTQPAASAGSLTTATVRIVATDACSASFKVKVLRVLGTQFGTFTVVAERGPFATPQFGGDITVALSPPIAVLAGDYLAVTQLNAAVCGKVETSATDSSHTALIINADLQTGATGSGNILRDTQINARASGDLPALVRVVPAVGSVQGGFGSFFRTAIQIAAGGTTGQTAAGRLVYHPSNRGALATDPGVDFSLVGRQSIELDDIVASLGTSGLGTLDVLSKPGSCMPLVTARVFNDNGAAGTQGFVEPAVRPRDAAGGNSQVFLSSPHDPANFRMNIGVRTFDQGVSFFVLYLDTTGAAITQTPTKTYAANYFEQVSLQQFLNNAPPIADGFIDIFITAGNAVIYGSTTDNRTNDSAVVLATLP